MSVREQPYRFVKTDCGYSLCVGRSRRAVVRIVADDRYPTMWRVVRPDGTVTDMVNLARAQDAALDHADKILSQPVARRARSAFFKRAATLPAPDFADAPAGIPPDIWRLLTTEAWTVGVGSAQ
jgi:hypothetical protein